MRKLSAAMAVLVTAAVLTPAVAASAAAIPRPVHEQATPAVRAQAKPSHEGNRHLTVAPGTNRALRQLHTRRIPTGTATTQSRQNQTLVGGGDGLDADPGSHARHTRNSRPDADRA